MATKTFFMTGPAGEVPGNIEQEAALQALLGEMWVPTFDTVRELRANIIPGYEDPALRVTTKVTVEVIDEADYLS